MTAPATKEEITEKIIAVVKTFDGKRNPSVIMQKLGWTKDTVNDMCGLFNVSKFSDILSQIPQIKIEKNEHGTTYVQLVQNTEHTQLNAKQEEPQMAETIKHHDRISALKNALSEGLYEKDEALRLALLAAIAGESIFFLGAPGCAKSMLARRIVQAFKADGDGSVQYFETLLNQFSTPEDVFGNISLKALNGELEDEQGNKKEEYRRLTENMLPEADIAFLDEIWKASPAILNTLLTIINERKFHNGSTVQDVPLKALLAASNELPAKDRGLEALYDRFIIRLPIGFIQNEDTFFDMVEGASSDFELSDEVKKLQISNEDLKNWKPQIDTVQLSEEARAVISAIRKELTAQNETLSEEEKNNGELFEVGDRRWKKIVRILKTSAFLNDRAEVDLMDCQLIEYCIWGTEKQQKKVRQIVETCIQQNGLDCDTAIDDINDEIEEFKSYINENFYKYEINKDDPVTKVINDEICYKIDINKVQYWINSKGLYDLKSLKNIQNIYDYSFDMEKGIVSWKNDRYGNSTNSHIYYYQHYIRDENIFNKPNVLESIKEKTDKDKYTPIAKNISREIDAINDFIYEKAAQYASHLFVDYTYCDLIMTAVIEARKDLQDAQVNLDKQRARYQ